MKNIKICHSFFTIGLIALSLFAEGQSGELQELSNRFTAYREKALPEKVFVHTDKTFYLAGEVMWFKLYVTDAAFNKPLDISKIAYIELLDRNNKPVLQAKIPLKDASGSGSFFLPFSINSGHYTLRAYTNWMKNFSADYFFHQPVTIVNTLKNAVSSGAATGPLYDVQFFPEGGNLVNGINSRVAFRIVDSTGRGTDCKGWLLNQHSDTVAAFSPLKFGLGSFYFTPSDTDTYKAVITVNDTTVIVNQFPKVYHTGYVMQLREAGTDALTITVTNNNSTFDNNLYLVVHTRGIIKAAELGQFSNGQATFNIQKSKLGEGVSHFTIFNNARQPVCERLYFKKPENLQLNLTADQVNYASREKVTVGIDAQNPGGAPVATDMSLSVFQIDSLQPADYNDILSYLWLSSDLRGNIESPAYYFTHAGPEAAEAADNLMLTQGWSRYVWEDVLKDTTPAFTFLPEYEGHIITGKITDKRTGLPAPNVMTYLTVPGIKFELAGSESNQQGQVMFDVKDFYGNNEIIVQPRNTADSNYNIDITNPFSEKITNAFLPPFRFPENLQGELLTHSIGTQVQDAYFIDSIQKFIPPPVKDTTEFFGKPDTKYFLDDYTRFTTMEEVMREYVPEVAVRRFGGKYHYKVLAAPHEFYNDDPLVMIDGLPVADIDKVMAFDPLKIKKLEVVTRQYLLGPLFVSGIVSYTTYNGNLEGFKFDPGSLVLEYDGLQLHRQFYMPVYETARQKASRVPDFRNVLYWSPDIKTNAQGKDTVSFYTSDRPGTYAIVVQGITADGRAGSKVVRFEVRGKSN